MLSKRPVGCSEVVESKSSAAEGVIGQILSKMKAQKFGEDDIFAVHLGLEEAFINAVRHGNKFDPAKKVTITYNIQPEKTEVCLADEGDGFAPDNVPDPTVGNNIYKIGGRGLFLIRSYMDKINFNKKGNCICMIRYNSNKGEKSRERFVNRDSLD
jgi:serine/threonine-protein kinase RsbW